MRKPVRLGPVGRPKSNACHIRQCVVTGGWDCWDNIDGLIAVVIPKDVLGRVVKNGVLFHVNRPVSYKYLITGLPSGFDRVLINRRVDQAQIVQDAAGLRAFTGPKESRYRNGRKEGDDCDHDHDFYQREAGAFGLKFFKHECVSFFTIIS
jgi:hypothetical protein